MRYLGNRKGAILIVVLGVLAILALLATTFATLQATEKRVARNYLDMVRAKLLAQSGAQDAINRLRETFPYRYFNYDPTKQAQKKPEAWKFWGPDETETVEPDATTSKLEEAINPSFAVEAGAGGNTPEIPQNPEDANFRPLKISIEGRQVGVSGVMGSGTYGPHTDHYALKVSDLSGMIYANDGVDQGRDGSVSQNLRRILNVLGDVIAIQGLGDMILNARPVNGYKSQQDLLKALGYDMAVFDRVKEFVTVHAWVDPNVANPVPLSASMISQYPVQYYRGAPPIYRMGSSKDAAGIECAPAGGYMTCPMACSTVPHENPAIRIYGLDSLNPQWIEIVSRAPVNINTAKREVLVALITDLKGFFIADRRRNNPRWKGELYLSFKQQNSLSPVGREGDEYGFLMETVPIVGPGGSQQWAISAFDLADEMIACRNRATSKNENYARGRWWEGAFKNWRQFNAFVDNLIVVGVIRDDRPYHFDYEQETQNPSGYGALVPSAMQKLQAARAAADVLKANFNPNLHLNELNPDDNMFQLVDKTDLFINSTEFCFLPTGHFEVESLGRVVRPATTGGDAYLAGNNELVAQAKVVATYKFYDLYRETNQHQFYHGELSRVSGVPDTNSGRSLEIGPEPDNGVYRGNHGRAGDPDNESAGYIAMPTIGGVYHSAPLKRPNTLRRTRQMSPTTHLNAAMHVHFTLDHDAHQHNVDAREIASAQLGPAIENVSNHPDMGLRYSGPYNPTSGPGGSLHRCMRSFRLTTPQGQGTNPTNQLIKYAPSDLRVDGAYSERHASPAYLVRGLGGAPIWNASTGPPGGAVTFWFKPSFYPELTGKVRQAWDWSRYHQVCRQNVNVWPFQLVFLPSHYNPSFAESNQPRYWHNNMGQFHPASMYWGSKQWHNDEARGLGGDGHAFGRVTKSLNHIGHDDETINPSPLRGHRWINVSFAWDPTPLGGQMGRLWINGDMSQLPFYSHNSMTGWNDRLRKLWKWEVHDPNEYNHMRFGAPSKICDAAVVVRPPGIPGAFRGNHTADFTIDEIYAWSQMADCPDPGRLLWNRGRYVAPPKNGQYGEGEFTSQAISLVSSIDRRLAPPSQTSAPGGGGTGGQQSLPQQPPRIRVLGVSWTWYGETPVDRMAYLNAREDRPSLYDWKGTVGAVTGAITPTDLLPRIRVTNILDGGQAYPVEYDQNNQIHYDGFAAVRTSSGGAPVIQDPTQIKYQVQFETTAQNAGGFGSILLSTPYLDDVTIYFDDTKTHLLAYVFESRAY